MEDIERHIRVLKERARCYWAMLPFEKIPKRMVVHILLTVSFYVNAFAPKSGISDHTSPMTIVEGVKLDYNKHFKVIPGEYAQTFEGSDNTMKERTIGAIALGPAGNPQGGERFFSLKTGRILNQSSKDFLLSQFWQMWSRACMPWQRVCREELFFQIENTLMSWITSLIPVSRIKELQD